MRFNREKVFNDPSDCLDLYFGNRSWPTCKRNKGMHSWSGQNLQSPIEPTAQENVTGEQWQGQSLDSVLPLTGNLIGRQEWIKSSPGEVFENRFLMLMASVHRVPCNARSAAFQGQFIHVNIASPSDLQVKSPEFFT